MSDAEDSRKRRRTDQTNKPDKPDKPDKPELNVEWTNLQRVWLKRVKRLFEDFGPPQPSLELKRREEVMQLRRRLSDKYAELIDTWKVSSRRNPDPPPSTDSPTLPSLPREAFNRWLMERINAGGTDPLLGGQADAPLLKAAAEGLEHDLCGPLHSEAAPKDFANFAEKVRGLCSWLASEADAAAERIARSAKSARSASQTSKVSATLNAKRGCYVFPSTKVTPASWAGKLFWKLKVKAMKAMRIHHLSLSAHLLLLVLRGPCMFALNGFACN